MVTHRPRPNGANPGGTLFVTWRLSPGQEPLLPEERDLVLAVLERDQGKVGEISAAVVMDDHVHVVVGLAQDRTIIKVMQAWKSISSHHLTRGCSRRAPVWQRGYFDRWLRSEERIRAAVAYILLTPERRWPNTGEYRWMIRPVRYR